MTAAAAAKGRHMADLLGMLYGDDSGDDSGDDNSEGSEMGDDLGDLLGDLLGGRRKRGRGRKTAGSKNWLRDYAKGGGAIGVPPSAYQEYPLGFDAAVFTPAGPQAITLQATPQLACKPMRPVIIVLRSAGALAVGVNLNDVKVGQRSQFISAAPIAAETYAPTSFGVMLAGSPAGPGIIVSLFYSTTIAPPAGEQVTVQSAIICHAAA